MKNCIEVKKCIKESSKVAKVRYFSFSVKVNRRKRAVKKIWFGGCVLQEDFCWEGFVFNRGLEIFLNGGGDVTRKGWEKIERGFDPQRNFDTSATAIYHTFANPILDFEDFGIVKNEISEHLVFFVS